MRTAGASALAACAVAGLYSCTLFVDLDGLSQETSDGGPHDASPDAGDTGARGDAADDASSDPCALPGVLYCTRFDDPSSLAAFRQITDDSTRIEVQTSTFLSPPAAATFTIERSNNMSADATLGITLGTSLRRAALRAKVRIDSREAVDGRLVSMRLGNGSAILLDHAGDVHESGVAKLGTVPSVPDGQWVDLRMELDGSVAPPKVRITIGNTAPTELSLPDGAWSPGEVNVIFGISETRTPTNGWLVRWDDVAIQEL